MNRSSLKLLAPGALMLALIAAYAGGWATVTVEDVPEYLVAGQPTNINFSIRQHGFDLIDGLRPTIEAASGGHAYKARAVESNRPGYYTAKLDMAQTGDWTITIHTGFGKSKLTLLPVPVVASNARPVAAVAEAVRGQRLFVAKGCVSCHVHGSVKESGTYDVGPVLTGRRFANDYLAQFLAKPAPKANSDKRMPDLNLKPGEIAALVAFINANGATGVAGGE